MTEAEVDGTSSPLVPTPPTLAVVTGASTSIISPDSVAVEMRTLAQLAVTLAAADIVPSALRRRPNDVFLVLLTGRELGIAPTTALRSLHVIEGQITLAPKLRLAMVRQRGGKVWPDPGNDATKSTWYTERDGIKYAQTFTWADAERVKISSTKRLVDKDNWKNYPGRMLQWRSLSALLDDAWSDVGTSLFSPDEIGAVTDEEGAPVDVIDMEPLDPRMAGARPAPEATIIAEEVQAIATAAAALPPGGRQVLNALWRERGWPMLPSLPASRYQIALALVASLTARAAKGEWAEETPQKPDCEHVEVAERDGMYACGECGEVFDNEAAESSDAEERSE